MKSLVLLLALSLFFGFGGSVLAQEDHHNVESTKDPATALVTYICPMHSEVRQTKPGECPICGMKLAPDESHAHDKEAQDNHNQGEHEDDHHHHNY